MGDASRMPRYFFHVSNGRTFRDDWGEHFLAAADAMDHAAKVAKELADEGGWGGYAVLVEDEHGREIGRVPID